MTVLGILLPWFIVGFISANLVAQTMDDGILGESLSATTKKVIVLVAFLGGLATVMLAIFALVVTALVAGLVPIVNIFKSKT